VQIATAELFLMLCLPENEDLAEAIAKAKDEDFEGLKDEPSASADVLYAANVRDYRAGVSKQWWWIALMGYCDLIQSARLESIIASLSVVEGHKVKNPNEVRPLSPAEMRLVRQKVKQKLTDRPQGANFDEN
jgi:hypothetical protein